jgi:hypothetical protein
MRTWLYSKLLISLAQYAQHVVVTIAPCMSAERPGNATILIANGS